MWSVVVVLDGSTVLDWPPKVTHSLCVSAANPDPEIVTGVPGAPLAGVNPVITPAGTVMAALPDRPPTVTVIGTEPTEPTADGTEVVSEVELALVTVAGAPLKYTRSCEGVLLKLLPVSVNVAPIVALGGDTDEITGALQAAVGAILRIVWFTVSLT